MADAEEIAVLVRESSDELRASMSAQRTSLQLVASTNAAEQLRLGEKARKRGQGLQTLIFWLTALFLVPTLVGTAFSALPNVYLNDSTARTALVVSLMVISAGVAAIIVLILQARR